MKLIFFFVFLFVFSFHLSAQQQKYSKVRVFLDGKPAQELMQLGVTCDHGHHRPSVHFESDFSQSDLRLMDLHGFRYEILIDDVADHYQQQNIEGSPRNNACNSSSGAADYPQPSNFSLGSMGGYLTYQQMLDNLDSMVSKYPNLITPRMVIDSANLTHQNRPIYWLRISDNPTVDENEPEALYNALHHAREPLALSQLIYYMWFLLENYSSSPEIQYIVDNTELYFVPCINPDGYVYNESTNPNGGGMWRKNRRNNGSDFGVDLNRNYGYEWAYDNIGSSGNTSSDTYRGPAPFSEPESQNIRDFCIAHNFIFSMNYHTYGAQLIYPWAYNDQLTPDSNEFRSYADLMTNENNYVFGTNMETIGYSTNGDADDWLYGEQSSKNKILSLTPEASTGGFWPPSSTITGHCQGTMWQNLAVAHIMLIYGQLTNKSLPLLSTLNEQAHFELTRLGMMSGNLTVSVTPLSSNILSTGVAQNFNVAQFTTVSDSISIQLDPAIVSGELVRYLLTVDNGFWSSTDTVERVYGNYSLAFNDNADTMANWSNQGSNSNWEVTTATYYSPTGCLTDSKNGNYDNNRLTEIVLNQSVDLTNATDANLEFWAKWDIETDYDYVQVMAAGNNGNYLPLCGIYTNSGTSNQAQDEPLYDGQQSSWVAERMSLNDFLGESVVNFKIILQSDFWVNEDGFYFDDFKVNVLSPSIGSNSYYLKEDINVGQNQPNPAALKVYIPLQIPSSFNQKLRLTVYNVLAQEMFSKDILNNTSGIEIEVENWEEGVYFYQLSGKGFISEPFKMVVSK